MTYADEYYHVMNRGNERKPLFFEEENYLFFLQRLRKYITKGKQELIAYCLMPNHFHLLLKETVEDNLKAAMHGLETSYAKAINKRYNRSGHLYQDTYKKIRIESNEQLLHLSRYIHLNPVEADLVSLPEEWVFSSYREYIGQRQGSLPKPEIVLGQFDDYVAYREFVMDGRDELDLGDLTLE